MDETTGEELTPLAHSSSRRVFAEQTAEKLQELLAGVVAEGTGRQAEMCIRDSLCRPRLRAEGCYR